MFVGKRFVLELCVQRLAEDNRLIALALRPPMARMRAVDRTPDSEPPAGRPQGAGSNTFADDKNYLTLGPLALISDLSLYFSGSDDHVCLDAFLIEIHVHALFRRLAQIRRLTGRLFDQTQQALLAASHEGFKTIAAQDVWVD
ncbi:hypothetical protein BURK2_01082 [Burkholderiales bacterium]|nr:hypothetical protein BURK2_01082 [Burkholderiales bacterium]